MSFLSLSIPSFSQDKALLARADSLHRLGCDLFAEQKYEDVINVFEKAAEIWRELQGDYSTALASSLNRIGVCYFYLGDYTKALEHYQQALAIREKVLGREHPDYAGSLNNIG